MPAEQRGKRLQDDQGLRNPVARRDAGQAARRASRPGRGRSWFRDVERKRMRGELAPPTPLTLAELVDEYLEQHVAEANTIRALRDRLKLATHGIPVKPRAKEREHGLGNDPRRPARRPHRRRVAQAATRGLRVARAQGATPGARLRGSGEARRGECRASGSEPGAETPGGAMFGAWAEVDRLADELPRRAPPSRSSSLVPGCGRRNGSRSSGATSTSTPACCMSGVSTPTEGQGLRETGTLAPAHTAPQPILEALEAHPWRIDSPLALPWRPRRSSGPAPLASGRVVRRARVGRRHRGCPVRCGTRSHRSRSPQESACSTSPG